MAKVMSTKQQAAALARARKIFNDVQLYWQHKDPKWQRNLLARARRIARQINAQVDLANDSMPEAIDFTVQYLDAVELRTGAMVWQ
jgi:hypothetical protein